MPEIYEQLFHATHWLSVRELIRLVLLSGLFALVCFTAFPRNAPSKRILFMISAATLMVLPWVIQGDWLVWSLPLETPPSFSLNQGLPWILFWLWFAIASLLLIRFFVAVTRELRQVHKLPIIPTLSEQERAMHAALHLLSERLHVPNPRLRFGKTACSTSLFRPTIVLPRSAAQWSDRTLASVLAHELVHIKRRDDLWLMAFRVCLLVYWWLPWISPMYAAFLRCVEESCDDQAAECIGHDPTYVEALADVAVGEARTGVVSMTRMHEHHLVVRINRFRQLRQIELDSSSVYWSVMGVIGLVLLLSGVEPALKNLTAEAQTSQAQRASDGKTEKIVLPVTHQYTLFPTPLSSTEQIRLQQPAFQTPVIYPGPAIRQGIEGGVTIGFLVQADGAVSNPYVVSSKPVGVFDRAALRAVLNSRYPAARMGATRQTAMRGGGSLGAIEIQRYFAFQLDTM